MCREPSVNVQMFTLSRAYGVGDKTLIPMPKVASSSIDIVMSDYSIDVRKATGKIATFVRNPYDRLISAYESFWSGLSFNHFMSQLIEHGSADVHLKRQTDLISPDWFGRLESFSEDWSKCCKWLGIEHRPMPHMNASRRKPMSAYYKTPDSVDWVTNYYAADFIAYGYSHGIS